MGNNKVCVAISGNCYERKNINTVTSFLFANRVESLSIHSLINEIKVDFDDFDENVTNDQLVDYFANLIRNDYNKALEILQRTDYEEIKEIPTLSNFVGLENSNNYNKFIDEEILLNCKKEKNDRPWDTRKDFFTKVSRRGYKHKKKKRK